jgi:hypothetical protein
MLQKHIGGLVVLFGVGSILGFADRLDAAKPDKLIKVTLESKAGIGVMPLQCFGADVVNAGGQIKDMRRETPLKRMTFECLPGAIVMVVAAEGGNSPEGGVLRMSPEDDDKILQLRFEKHTCYKNDVVSSVDLTKDENGKRRDVSAELALIRLAIKETKTKSLTVVFDMNTSSLPILQELKGTGVGLVVERGPRAIKDMPDSAMKELCSAIADVEPRYLELAATEFNQIKERLSKVESLCLSTDSPPNNGIPDLTKVAQLRHLTLIAEKGRDTIDLKPLEKLTQLTSLTIFDLEQECKNPEAISSLRQLQFLVAIFKSPCDPAVFKPLTNLRYLATTFPLEADFSFAEYLPDLQTLCILNINEKHNLKPIEKLQRLRCFAMSENPEGDQKDDSKEFKPTKFANVKAFVKARPDVAVVEYRGICLGSFWLLPLAALAAVVAWLIRRWRLANRPASGNCA